MTADRVEEMITVPRRLDTGDGPDPSLEEGPGRFPLVAWWHELEVPERVLYRGLGAVSFGMLFVDPPMAAIIPGAVLAGLAVFTLALVAWRAP